MTTTDATERTPHEPAGGYRTRRHRCKDWARAIRKLRQAADAVERFQRSLTDCIDPEAIHPDAEPSIGELHSSTLPAIEWQTRHALRLLSNDLPAGVEYLLGWLAPRECESQMDTLAREFLTAKAREQLGEVTPDAVVLGEAV